MIKVHFVHGLESSPSSRKARVLAEHFDALTPAMDTADFEGCIDVHRDIITERPPDVVVGSSFGGAVALALLQRGFWSGPTLLLAQAGLRYGLEPRVPSDSIVWLVHAVEDDVVAIADSRVIAEQNPQVTLIEVADDHALTASVAEGRLVEWVSEIYEAAKAGEVGRSGN
jgi:hypothetical protein